MQTVPQGPISWDRLLVDIISLARALNILSAIASTWTTSSPLTKICWSHLSSWAITIWIAPLRAAPLLASIEALLQDQPKDFSAVADPGGFWTSNRPWGAQAFKGYEVFAFSWVSCPGSFSCWAVGNGWLVSLKFLRKHPCCLQQIKVCPGGSYHSPVSAKEGSLVGSGITSVGIRIIGILWVCSVVSAPCLKN